MGYLSIPGSNTDLYSGTILSAIAGTSDSTDGTVLGTFLKPFWKVFLSMSLSVFIATGVPFVIGVTNLDADQTSSQGFDLIYAQTPCSLSF